VDVPVNSTATVSIPWDPEMTEFTVREADRIVWEKGRFVEGTPGLKAEGIAGVTPGVMSGSFKDKRVIFEVGSGHYCFRLNGE
jgi:hypothetical protein